MFLNLSQVTDVDVRSKCGELNSGDLKERVYNFGPCPPVYTVIFKDGKLCVSWKGIEIVTAFT
jgi:hypothetical protein